MSTGNAMKRRTRITLGLGGIAAAGFGIFYGVVAGHGISQAAPTNSPASSTTTGANSTTTQQQPSFQQQPTTRNTAPSAPAPRTQVHTRSRGS